eukprot:TRINITY_DN6989_c0_g1_i1.p1 TRINITY_DN6989_c0_g1~~TRINITY_DN6989_c0_g1_i1.p1  ORF type:complete len:625 (-),score=73.05 TRINITY_DN6989_c0_g1_i1:97-1971(-)
MLHLRCTSDRAGPCLAARWWGESDLLRRPAGCLHCKPRRQATPRAGAAAAVDPAKEGSVLRELGPKDRDLDAVVNAHPKLVVTPIGSYNHWDRRECAVGNPEDWRASCAKYMKDIGGVAEIPKVMHMIWVGPKEPPCLWIDTLRSDYCEAHPEWKFEMWSDEQVKDLPMFNREIYDGERMWQCKADILRLEFLWHHGGVYVDADMISVGNKSLDPIIELGKETGFVIAYEPDTKDKPYSILGNSVIACTAHHPLILMLILFLKQTFHQKRNQIEVFAVTGPVMYTKCLVDSDMPISIARQELLYPAFHYVPNPDAIDFSRFPECLLFQFGYTCSGLEGYVKRKNRCKKPRECTFHKNTKLMGSHRMLANATDQELFGQVPITLQYLKDYAELPWSSGGSVPLENGIATFITDGELVSLQDLRRAVPGFVDSLRSQTWDVMLLGMEWNTGANEAIYFNVPPNGRPRDSQVCGILVNCEGGKNIETVRSLLRDAITERGFDATPLFNAADRISLWFGAQKLAGTPEEARILRNMSVVHRIFKEVAHHEPPMHYEQRELHGNTMKGIIHGRNGFEMCAEDNGTITWRAWNDDGSPNCELRCNSSKIEWMKVFNNHQVVFDAHDKPLP